MSTPTTPTKRHRAPGYNERAALNTARKWLNEHPGATAVDHVLSRTTASAAYYAAHALGVHTDLDVRRHASVLRRGGEGYRSVTDEEREQMILVTAYDPCVLLGLRDAAVLSLRMLPSEIAALTTEDAPLTDEVHDWLSVWSAQEKPYLFPSMHRGFVQQRRMSASRVPAILLERAAGAGIDTNGLSGRSLL